MITSSSTCCSYSCIGLRNFSHAHPHNQPNQVYLRYVPSTSYRFLQTPTLAVDALATRIQFPMNRAWSLLSQRLGLPASLGKRKKLGKRTLAKLLTLLIGDGLGHTIAFPEHTIDDRTCWRNPGTTIHHPIPRLLDAIPVELVGMGRMVRCTAMPTGCTALDKLLRQSLDMQRSLAMRSLAGWVGRTLAPQRPLPCRRLHLALVLVHCS
jgi:hypothetical protein